MSSSNAGAGDSPMPSLDGDARRAQLVARLEARTTRTESQNRAAESAAFLRRVRDERIEIERELDALRTLQTPGLGADHTGTITATKTVTTVTTSTTSPTITTTDATPRGAQDRGDEKGGTALERLGRLEGRCAALDVQVTDATASGLLQTYDLQLAQTALTQLHAAIASFRIDAYFPYCLFTPFACLITQ